jgi:hypothetical protein
VPSLFSSWGKKMDHSVIEIAGFVVTVGLAVGTILWRLSAATTTFTLIGRQQAQEIGELKVAVEKMETAITAIAVQDVKIVALNQRLDMIEKRSDERIAKLERVIEDMQHGRGFINPT